MNRSSSIKRLNDDLYFQLRRRLLQYVAVTTILLSPFVSFVNIINGTTDLTPTAALITAAFVFFGVILLWLERRGRFELATVLLITLFGAASLLDRSSWSVLAITLAVLTSTTMASNLIFIPVIMVFIGHEIYDAVVIGTNEGATTPEFTGQIAFIITLIIITLMVRYFVITTQRAAQINARKNAMITAASEVGQIAASLLDLDELLTRVVELIRDRFAFYHVQVFLLDDERENAVLVSSTGEPGRLLLERNHRLPVGSQSVIGRVTQFGEPVVALDTSADPAHRRNEFLPDTRSELALPIVDGTLILGALDVQSTRRNAFHQDDIQALQIMVNVLATSIRNARLFETQVKNVQENQRLLAEAQANIEEIKRLNQQLTGRAWTEFLGQPNAVGGVTLKNNQVVQDAEWSENLVTAATRKRVVSQVNEKGMTVAVPVTLRGEVIGAIEVEPGTEVRETDSIEMIQAVAERLAISLDNARLFEEAQQATRQEQRINEIASRYQGAQGVDDLLRVTLTELSQSLGANKAAIRLGNLAPTTTTDGEPAR